jgi:hypothetical protein
MMEIKPGLREQAKRVLETKRTDSEATIAAYVAGLLAGEFDLSAAQGEALRAFLAKNCALAISEDLCNGWICASYQWSIQAPLDWNDLGKMDFDDLSHRLNQLADDEHLRVALLAPSDFYLDLRDPNKPKAASFSEALAKADDCRAHAVEIERAIWGFSVEDVLREMFEKVRQHTIAGKPEDNFKIARAGKAVLGENAPWTVSAIEIAKAMLPPGTEVTAEALAATIMKHVAEKASTGS